MGIEGKKMSEGRTKPGLNRRELLGALAAAGALTLSQALTRSARALGSEFSFDFEGTSAEQIHQDKQRAIRSLTDGLRTHTSELQRNPELWNALVDMADKLPDESTMYAPGTDEADQVLLDGAEDLNTLAAKIPMLEYGIYIDARPKVQRMYVLQKIEPDQVRIVKAYKISTSARGLSGNLNAEGLESGKTPLGLHTIKAGTQGLLGQVMSKLNKYKDKFLSATIGRESASFATDLVDTEDTDEPAEVLTDQYHLFGSTTSGDQAIRIHGTNRVNQLGRSASGGCIRMSNVDVRDVGQYIMGDDGKPKNVHVMIHGTPTVGGSGAQDVTIVQPRKRKKSLKQWREQIQRDRR